MTERKDSALEFMRRRLRFAAVADVGEIVFRLGYRNVAIWGEDAVLCEQLHAAGVSVGCVIAEGEVEFPFDVRLVRPEDFGAAASGMDAVIMARGGEAFKYTVVEYTDLPVLTLQGLVVDVDILSAFLDAERHIAESGASLLMMDLTNPLFEIKNPSDNELTRLYHYPEYNDFFRPRLMKPLLSFYDDIDYCDTQYVHAVHDFANELAAVRRHGVVCLQDFRSEFVNIAGGLRYTPGNPERYDGTIHLFGNCLAFGRGTEDKLTIAGRLQELFANDAMAGKIYRVLNRGTWHDCLDSFLQMRGTPFNSGDIVVLLNSKTTGLAYYTNPEITRMYNVNSAFDRPHGMGEIFFDCYHMNHRGYKLLADRFYAVIKGNETGRVDGRFEAMREFAGAVRERINAKARRRATEDGAKIAGYLDAIRSKRISREGRAGAIVMNCNPFTNGHLYLIERASEECGVLYVFVVEEDRSLFKFADRLEMVQKGTAHLANVVVLPGGSYIISAETLPEYFTKEERPDLKIDASKDLNIFAEIIAPALGVTKRFVGDEPFDPITAQYNRAMKDILPLKNISVSEIPRKTSLGGGGSLSAPRASASYYMRVSSMKSRKSFRRPLWSVCA